MEGMEASQSSGPVYSEEYDCMIVHSGSVYGPSGVHRLAFLTSLRSSREVEDGKKTAFSVMATADGL